MSLEMKLRLVQAECDERGRLLSQSKHATETLHAELVASRRETEHVIDEAERKYDEQRERLRSLHDELATLRSECEAKRGTLEAAKRQVGQLTLQLEEQQHAAELEAYKVSQHLKEKDRKLIAVEDQMDTLISQKADLERHLHEAEEKIDLLEAQRDSAVRGQKDITRTGAALVEERNALVESLADVRQQLALEQQQHVFSQKTAAMQLEAMKAEEGMRLESTKLIYERRLQEALKVAEDSKADIEGARLDAERTWVQRVHDVEMNWEKRLRDGVRACEQKFNEEKADWDTLLKAGERSCQEQIASMEQSLEETLAVERRAMEAEIKEASARMEEVWCEWKSARDMEWSGKEEALSAECARLTGLLQDCKAQMEAMAASHSEQMSALVTYNENKLAAVREEMKAGLEREEMKAAVVREEISASMACAEQEGRKKLEELKDAVESQIASAKAAADEQVARLQQEWQAERGCLLEEAEKKLKGLRQEMGSVEAERVAAMTRAHEKAIEVEKAKGEEQRAELSRLWTERQAELEHSWKQKLEDAESSWKQKLEDVETHWKQKLEDVESSWQIRAEQWAEARVSLEEECRAGTDSRLALGAQRELELEAKYQQQLSIAQRRWAQEKELLDMSWQARLSSLQEAGAGGSGGGQKLGSKLDALKSSLAAGSDGLKGVVKATSNDLAMARKLDSKYKALEKALGPTPASPVSNRLDTLRSSLQLLNSDSSEALKEQTRRSMVMSAGAALSPASPYGRMLSDLSVKGSLPGRPSASFPVTPNGSTTQREMQALQASSTAAVYAVGGNAALYGSRGRPTAGGWTTSHIEASEIDDKLRAARSAINDLISVASPGTRLGTFSVPTTPTRTA